MVPCIMETMCTAWVGFEISQTEDMNSPYNGVIIKNFDLLGEGISNQNGNY